MAANQSPIDIKALMDDPQFAKTAQQYANLDPTMKAVLQRITPNSDYFTKQLNLLKMADEKMLGESKNALLKARFDASTANDIGMNDVAWQNLDTKFNALNKPGYEPAWHSGNTAKDLLGLGSVIAAGYGAKTKIDVADKLTESGYGLQAYQKLFT